MAPAPQVFPQAPQFVGSVLVSEQRPLHTVCPPRHAHVPPAQIWLPAHAFPQPPQLPASFSGSTQLPLQVSSPTWQTQPELRHVSPTGHLTPQLPQFCGSLRGVTHAPLQTVSRGEQLAVQRPRLQTSEAPHAAPHAPQLS